MNKAFERHLAAVRAGEVTRSNIIGMRKGFNAWDKDDRRATWSTEQADELTQAIWNGHPRAVGELHEGGLKVLRNPRYAKRWNDRQRAIINYPLVTFRLVRFDFLRRGHCVPVFRVTGDEQMGSFTFRNIPWQSAYYLGEEDGPRVVED